MIGGNGPEKIAIAIEVLPHHQQQERGNRHDSVPHDGHQRRDCGGGTPEQRVRQSGEPEAGADRRTLYRCREQSPGDHALRDIAKTSAKRLGTGR